MIVNLSGYMFSGKSAVFDLLSEFKSIHHGHYQEEFDLFRVAGGLIDLSVAVNNWSFMGVDGALKRYERVSKRICGKVEGVNRLFNIGWDYESRYPGITAANEAFINSLSEVEWNAEWPFDELESDFVNLFLRKISDRLPFSVGRGSKLRMCSPEHFSAEANLFVQKIFENNFQVKPCGKTIYLITNALDVTNPFPGLGLSSKLYNIIVDRDVRDIYADSVTHLDGYNNNVEKFSRISGAFDVDLFIKRQRLLRRRFDHVPSDLLKRNKVIYFDDLILNFDETKEQILTFLGVDDVTDGVQSFQIEKSLKNVGKWRKLDSSYASAIKRIEDELPDLCVQNKLQ